MLQTKLLRISHSSSEDQRPKRTLRDVSYALEYQHPCHLQLCHDCSTRRDREFILAPCLDLVMNCNTDAARDVDREIAGGSFSPKQDAPLRVHSGLAQCLQIEPVNPVAIPVVDASTVFDAADRLVPDAGALMPLERRATRAAASTHATAMEVPGVPDPPATAPLILKPARSAFHR